MYWLMVNKILFSDVTKIKIRDQGNANNNHDGGTDGSFGVFGRSLI